MSGEVYYAGLFPTEAEQRANNPEQDTFSLQDPAAWRSLYGESGGSGVAVSQSSAMSIPAIWQAVSAISHDCAMIPARAYKPNGNAREPDDYHAGASLLDRDNTPDGEHDGYTVLRRWLIHACLWPNGFLWIERKGSTPIGLYNLLPDRTWVERSRRGRLYVRTEYRDPTDESRALPQSIPIEDCLVLHGPSWDDNGGLGVVKTFREQVKTALGKRRYEARLFDNNCSLGGILQVPPGMATEKVEKIEKGFEERHKSADKAFKIAVLRDGVKFHATMSSLADIQNVELDEANARQAARIFNMPPSRLGVKDSSAYNSDESAKRAYYDNTLSSWLFPMRSQFNLKLRSQTEKRLKTRIIEHDVRPWLFADTQTVADMAVKLVGSGIYAADEVRGWFGDSPLADGAGAKVRVPLNTSVVGQDGTPEDEPKPAPKKNGRRTARAKSSE